MPVETLIDFIYDIFCISKYKQDPKVSHKINSSLKKNINDYIAQNPAKIGETFGPDQAVELLLWCIQHNEIFHVEYDPKDKNSENEGRKESDLSVEVKKEEMMASESKAEREGGVEEDSKGEPEEEERAEAEDAIR